MNDIERSARHFCQVNRSYVGFAFHFFILSHIVPPGIYFAFIQILFYQNIVYVSVFCMNANQCADFCCLLQNLIERTVIYTEIVYHKYLEGRNSCFNGIFHRIQKLIRCDVANPHMEGVIHRRIGSGQGISSLDGIQHHFSLSLKNEIEYGSGSSASSGTCSSEVVIGRDGSSKRHSQMSVPIYGSRQDHLAFGIHYFGVFLWLQVGSYGSNFTVRYGHVCFKGAFRGNHGSAFN